MHVLPVDGEFSFWVDTGPLGKRTDIAPTAGLRHSGVEALFATLLGVPRDEYSGTVGANVGEIVSGHYSRWEPPSRPEVVLEAIDLALAKMRPFMTLERLAEAWTIAGDDPGRLYRLVVISLLRGDLESAERNLSAARDSYAKHGGEGAEQFAGFEGRVRERMAREKRGATVFGE
jgi:hypothetical protein